ncbi:MAG: hypothetical protein HY514_04630 [Candidatus Aenigmarchaeota archaeon]|nr:hypothetical protein [Candidatus Aenigmarchaeota archaeon]
MAGKETIYLKLEGTEPDAPVEAEVISRGDDVLIVRLLENYFQGSKLVGKMGESYEITHFHREQDPLHYYFVKSDGESVRVDAIWTKEKTEVPSKITFAKPKGLAVSTKPASGGSAKSYSSEPAKLKRSQRNTLIAAVVSGSFVIGGVLIAGYHVQNSDLQELEKGAGRKSAYKLAAVTVAGFENDSLGITSKIPLYALAYGRKLAADNYLKQHSDLAADPLIKAWLERRRN